MSNDYNVLVLGPGGNKGIVELGALHYCEIKDILRNVKKVCGVSIGAIIGLLYTSGYISTEILNISMSTNLLDLNNILPFSEMIKNQGAFSQRSFEKRLNDLIEAKFGLVPTLQQLFNSTGIEFSIVTTNVKVSIEEPLQRAEIFNYHNRPDISCVKAALMSSNIPGFFGRIEYDNGTYIDGALSNPYPVEMYDSPGNRVLGISITGIPSSGGNNTFDYFLQSIHSPIINLRENIKKHSSERVDHLDILVVVEAKSSLITDINEKKEMFNRGYKKTKEFFEKENFSGIILSGDSKPDFD